MQPSRRGTVSAGNLNAEQGDQVWVRNQLRASWSKIWPALRYLG